MSIESDYDGRHISDFTEQETTDFINDLLTLEYVGYEKVYKGSENDKRVFLRIHLEDGSSFRVVYWLESNALTIGAFGTEKMKEIMENKVNNK